MTSGFVQHTSTVSLKHHSPVKDIVLKRKILCVKPSHGKRHVFFEHVYINDCVNYCAQSLEHDFCPACGTLETTTVVFQILNCLRGSASKPSPQAIWVVIVGWVPWSC